MGSKISTTDSELEGIAYLFEDEYEKPIRTAEMKIEWERALFMDIYMNMVSYRNLSDNQPLLFQVLKKASQKDSQISLQKVGITYYSELC
jgi:hypothetical protein